MGKRIEVQRICQQCGDEFTAKTTVTKYCTHKCNQKAYKARKRNEKVVQKSNNIEERKIEAIELLKTKEFLTVREVAQLLNCSIRSVYYYIEEGTIRAVNLGQRLTRIKRSEIDNLFTSVNDIDLKDEEPIQYSIHDCYNLTEVQNKYGISEKALYDIIKRNKIPKQKKGWYAYVPKVIIDNLFTKSN